MSWLGKQLDTTTDRLIRFIENDNVKVLFCPNDKQKSRGEYIASGVSRSKIKLYYGISYPNTNLKRLFILSTMLHEYGHHLNITGFDSELYPISKSGHMFDKPNELQLKRKMHEELLAWINGIKFLLQSSTCSLAEKVIILGFMILHSMFCLNSYWEWMMYHFFANTAYAKIYVHEVPGTFNIKKDEAWRSANSLAKSADVPVCDLSKLDTESYFTCWVKTGQTLDNFYSTPGWNVNLLELTSCRANKNAHSLRSG